jgi:hypothetical protein
MTGLVVAALVIGFQRDRGWVRIGSVDAVARAKVLHVSNLGVFVVYGEPLPVALSGRGPAGRPVSYCPVSGTFLDSAGDEFDVLGARLRGPAQGSLQTVAVRVRNGYVDVKPGAGSTPGTSTVPSPAAAAGRCAVPAASAPPFLPPAP